MTISELEILGTRGTTELNIKWHQNISGTVKMYVDGVLVKTLPEIGAGVYTDFLNVSDNAKNHLICLE